MCYRCPVPTEAVKNFLLGPCQSLSLNTLALRSVLHRSGLAKAEQHMSKYFSELRPLWYNRSKREWWETVTRTGLLVGPNDSVSTQINKDARCASSPSPLLSGGKIGHVFSSSGVCTGLVGADPGGPFTLRRRSAWNTLQRFEGVTVIN